MKIKNISVYLMFTLILLGCDTEDWFNQNNYSLKAGSDGRLFVTNITEDSFTVSWEAAYFSNDQDANDLEYLIYLNDMDSYDYINPEDIRFVTFENLEPDSIYSVTVEAQSGDKVAEYELKEVTTDRDIPGYIGVWHSFGDYDVEILSIGYSSVCIEKYTLDGELIFSDMDANWQSGDIYSSLNYSDNGESITRTFNWSVLDGNLFFTYEALSVFNPVREYHKGRPLTWESNLPDEYNIVDGVKYVQLMVEDIYTTGDEIHVEIFEEVGGSFNFMEETSLEYDSDISEYSFEILAEPTVGGLYYIRASILDDSGYIATSGYRVFGEVLLENIIISNSSPSGYSWTASSIIMVDEQNEYRLSVYDELISNFSADESEGVEVSLEIDHKPMSSLLTVEDFTLVNNYNQILYYWTPDSAGNYSFIMNISDGIHTYSRSIEFLVMDESEGVVNVSIY